MHTAFNTAICTLGLSLALAATAQDHTHHPAPSATATSGAEAVMTVGEVTRVDARGAKLTIRHEEIRNLDMPAMTMVFGLKDANQVAGFKPGDKVLFHAEDNAGSLNITRIRIVE